MFIIKYWMSNTKATITMWHNIIFLLYIEMDKIEEEINAKIDIPKVNEQEEGYLIHLVVSLILTIIYFVIRIYT